MTNSIVVDATAMLEQKKKHTHKKIITTVQVKSDRTRERERERERESVCINNMERTGRLVCLPLQQYY